MGPNVTAISGRSCVQQTLLAGQHGRQAGVVRVVPAEQVQQTMAGQPLQFPLQAVLVFLGLASALPKWTLNT